MMADIRSWLTADEDGPFYRVTINGGSTNTGIAPGPPPSEWSSSPYGYGDDPPPPDDYDPDEEDDGDDELSRALADWRERIT